jgi:hypothetical protein
MLALTLSYPPAFLLADRVHDIYDHALKLIPRNVFNFNSKLVVILFNCSS